MNHQISALAALLLVSLPFPAAPQSAASIEGRVINAATNTPVRKVNLTLARTGDTSDPATTQTDDKGNFAFSNLEPGTYKLSGERNSYQHQEYGARLNPNSGTPLHVAVNEAIKDLTFKLTPAAVISGRVLDQDGEPMPNLLVSALKSSYVHGTRQWVLTGTMQTNDRGEFRISGLRPGRYLVSATDLGVTIALAGVNKDVLADKPEPGYATAYSGNSTDIASAVPIDLAMGEDHRGSDIRMVKTATLRIRGKVIGALPDKPLILMVTRKNSAIGSSAPGGLAIVQQKDGTFEVKGLTAGSYLLSVRGVTDSSIPVNAVVPIELTEHHVEGFEFRLEEGAELSGSVAMAAAKTEELKAITVNLEMADFQLPDAPNAKPAADGTFTLKNIVAGTYRATLNGLPDDAFTKSVKLNGQPIDPTTLDLRAAPSGKLEFVVSRTAAHIEGTVTSADDKPLPGATVALIPDPRSAQRYQDATTDQRGKFRFTRVPPGKYKMLAWEDLEPGAFQDPEFVKPLESKADQVTVEDKGAATVTLKAIPFNLH